MSSNRIVDTRQEPLRRILAATDFSEDAGCAVSRAAALAAEHGAALTLVHVINASTLDALRTVFVENPGIAQALLVQTQQAMDTLAAEVARERTHATGAVRVGPVLDELLAAAADCDVLVLGAHGVNAMRDRILGTTAERLLGRCPAPIVVSRRGASGPYRRLLVPVDLSPYSAPALATAARIAPAADIQLFHVYDVPFEGKLWLAGVPEADIEKHRDEARAQATADMNALADATLPGHGKVQLALERGEPAQRILDRAGELAADLVVIGKQGSSTIGDLLLGSVTRHVLANAECDVLVVPPAALERRV